MLNIKRVYLPPHPDDGYRVLVDRLWPRGVTRAQAELDEWLAILAPSAVLRTWFGHRADRWIEFQQRYLIELTEIKPAAELRRLSRIARGSALTLVYAARNEQENHAVILRQAIESAK
ncbi:MAG: DUF488 family protein [Rhodomicrobium sp.]|nr:DUF488 family protein [Rhodomicrobium sp.]